MCKTRHTAMPSDPKPRPSSRSSSFPSPTLVAITAPPHPWPLTPRGPSPLTPRHLPPTSTTGAPLSTAATNGNSTPLIDVTPFSYFKVLGKGMLPPTRPVIVKATLVSKIAKKKNKATGGAVLLTASPTSPCLPLWPLLLPKFPLRVCNRWICQNPLPSPPS